MSARFMFLRASPIAWIMAWAACALLSDLVAAETPGDSADASSPAVRNPLTLVRALELLHRDDPRISAAQADIEAARGARHNASRFTNPTLTLALGGVSPGRPMATTDLGPIYGAQLDQLFESPGRRLWRTADADFTMRSAQSVLTETVRQRTLAVIREFYAALLARECERTCDQELVSLEQARAGLAARIGQEGAGTRDLDTLQVGTIPYEQAKESFAADYRDHVSELLAMISPRDVGDVIPSMVLLDGDFACAPTLVTREALLTRAHDRADVVATYQIAESARALYRVSADQRVPDVTLGVNATQQGRDTTLGVVASIELPVLNTYAGSEAEAWARWRAADFRYHGALASALADADKAWTSYESAQRVLALYSPTAITSAHQTADTLQAAHAQGSASMLDLLAARRLHSQTLTGFLQAQCAMRMAVATLDSLAGTDAPSPAPAAP